VARRDVAGEGGTGARGGDVARDRARDGWGREGEEREQVMAENTERDGARRAFYGAPLVERNATSCLTTVVSMRRANAVARSGVHIV
jgi:hypothetical protein